MLDGENLIYKRHLDEAIDLSKSLAEEIRIYYQDLSDWQEFIYDKRFGCLLPHSYDEFSGTYVFFDSLIKYIQPNEITLIQTN